MGLICAQIYRPVYDKSNKTTCVSEENSDQSGHPQRPIRVFTFSVNKPCGIPSGGGGGGGEGTLIFSNIRRLESFFLFTILNFNIFWVFRKMNIFGGMKYLLIFFFFGGGSSQNLTIFRVHFYAL